MASKSAGQLVSMRAQLAQERKESQEREAKSAEEARRLAATASAAEARAKAAEELTATIVGKLETAEEQHQAALAEVKNLAKRLKRERKDLREEVKSLQRAREAAARRAADDLAMAELTAVEKYKTSADYEKAMVEGTVDSYLKGIDVTLERVRRLHPHLNLDGLESDDEAEAEEASDEEVEAEETGIEETEAGVDDGAAGIDWSDGEQVAVTSPVDGRPIEEDPSIEREAVEGTDREDQPVEGLEDPARPGTLVVALPAAPPEIVDPIEIE